MRNSICRSLRSAITPRPTLRFLGVSELYHPATTTPPPRQPNAATNKAHTPSDLLTDRLSAPRAHHHPLTTLNQIFNLQGFHTAAFSLHKHDLKTLACNDVGTRGFSTAAAAAAPPPRAESKEIRAKETGIGGTAKKVISFTLLPNLALFWHINEGIEEILSDYVHQEMTRNLIAINLRLFLIIIAKDVFLSLV